MIITPPSPRILVLLASPLLLAVVAAADDSDFFTDSVPPNVLMLLDSSYSMREIMYHPDFTSDDSTCVMFNRIAPNDGSPAESGTGNLEDDNGDDTSYNCDGNTNHCRFQINKNHADFVQTHTVNCYDGDTEPSGYIERTYCGNTRKLYIDGESACVGANTWHSEVYIEWFFSDVADPHFIDDESNTSTDVTKIDANDNGLNYLTGDTYPLFKRTRLSSAKQIAREVIYQTNSNCGLGQEATCTSFSDRVRFGIAEFDGSHGGYVSAAIDDYTDNSDEIEDALDDMAPNDSTPLAESLFKTYTYFMSRSTSELPLGQDETTTFPKYQYRTSNGDHSPGNEPPDPIQCPDGSSTCPCQKHFVILIADGDSFNDHFTTSGTDTQGFSDFSDLIGDYNNDGETETGHPSNGTLYLDDIALFMQERDFRPLESDQEGLQNIDLYTVGFNLDTTSAGGALLQKAAQVGNGQSHFGTQASQIQRALVSSIAEIIDKTQSFTAATVPASRTTDDNNFYSSYFRPRPDSPYWEGHLKNFKFNLNGDVLSGDDKCVIGAAPQDPPCPTSGVLRTSATGVWDAGEEVPAPLARKLYVGDGGNTFGQAPPDWFVAGSPATTSMDRHTLELNDAPSSRLQEDPYNLSASPSNSELDDLAEDIVSNVSGCTFGTRLGDDCVTRTDEEGNVSLLGDIFHSNPVIAGSPNQRINDYTYKQFAVDFRDRDRVIYAASNDGWLHGFHAGDWQTHDPGPPATPLTPPRHDRGTGEELFGFMPSEVRKKIWELPVSMNNGSYRDFYGPDGSAVMADVWMYRNISGSNLSSVNPTVARQKEQWRSVLISGLRQGGRSYYALDVTDPGGATYAYPGYLWEFPCDDCNNAVNPDSADNITSLSRSPKDYLGETWSEPVITRVRVTLNGETAPQERWVAILGGGYDVCGDPNRAVYFDTGSGQDCDASTAESLRGRAVMMIDITTGELLGAKFYSSSDVTLGANGQLGYDEMDYAFASQPAVYDLNFDGYADVVYIGDLGGNLWKWVVNAVGHDPINNTGSNASLAQPDWPFEIFFRGAPSSATPSAGTHHQSFFFPPTAALSGGKLVIAFGAGERTDLEAGAVDATTDDHLDLDNNHYYVIKDVDPYAENSPDPQPAAIVPTLTESNLVPIAEVDDGTKDCADVANASGYFLTGRDREKFVTNSSIFLGEVITSSFLPADPSANTCNATGSAFLYRFDLACGSGSYPSNPGGEDDKRRKAIGGGLPTRPRISVGDLNSGTSSSGCKNKMVMITSDGGIENDCPGSLPTSGIEVRTWRMQH